MPRATGSAPLAPAPRALDYVIVDASSEAPGHPATELHVREGDRSRGWESARGASFPARVVARLKSPSDVRQLRVLSHEFKIASSARVSVACVDRETGGIVVKRLGTLRFDSNGESGYRARELKTVHVNVKDATEVRLEFPGCHENAKNDGRQIGLIALTIIGETSVGLDRFGESRGERAPLLSQRPGASLDVDEVDAVTAEKIREVMVRKEHAVDAEDYDEAKRLRGVIAKLREFGLKVKVLQEQKMRAVDAEDYDEAKRLKIEIDKMRSNGYEDAFAAASSKTSSPRVAEIAKEPAPEAAVVLPPSPSMVSPRAAFSFDDVPIRSKHADAMRAMASSGQPSSPRREDVSESFDRAMGSASYTAQDQPPRPRPLEISSKTNSSFDDGAVRINYDEIPAKASGRRVPPELEKEAEAFFEQEEEEKVAAARAEAARAKDENELPEPLPLSPSEQVNSAAIITVFGEEVVVRLYSQVWLHRESALQEINTRLIDAWENPETSNVFGGDARETFNVLCKTLGDRLFNDKVANVTCAAAITLASAAKAFAEHVSARDVRDAVGESISLLVDKLGDTNPRLRESVREAMHSFASDAPGGVSILAHALCKPVQKLSVWRVLTGRLTLLVELIPTYGLDAPEKENSFALEEVMKFATKCFDSANGEARGMAMKVVMACVDIVGGRVRRYLPRTLKSAIRDAIETAIDENEDPYDIRGRSASASKSPTTSTSPWMRSPTPAKSPSARSDRGIDWHDRSSSVGDDVPPELSANVALLEREITRRIETHGEKHPDVAAAMNDLATLYSENEVFARALALFERALGIQEETLGASHPETVQTLTDLAICHLDREDNRLGRPLLERALEMQIQILGPDHPDVGAIRDVLASLEDEP